MTLSRLRQLLHRTPLSIGLAVVQVGCGGGGASTPAQMSVRIDAGAAIAGFEVKVDADPADSDAINFLKAASKANAVQLRRADGNAQASLLVYVPVTGLLPTSVTSSPVMREVAERVRVKSIRCVDRNGNDVTCAARWGAAL